MANGGALNSSELNATIADIDLNLDNISFNNYGLQNKNIVTEGEGFGLRDYPDRRIDLINTPQGDGQILNDTFFGGRTINVSGYLIEENRSKLDILLDEFKLKLSDRNGLLKWRVNGELRQIRATVSDITFGTKEKIYIPFDITFKSQDSYWSKLKQQSVYIEGLNNSPRIDDILNKGTVSRPLYIFGFKNASNVDFISIKIDGIGCNIYNQIQTGDILVINSKDGTISINGTNIDFEGVVPVFKNGYNNQILEINGEFETDINIVYPENFI